MTPASASSPVRLVTTLVATTTKRRPQKNQKRPLQVANAGGCAAHSTREGKVPLAPPGESTALTRSHVRVPSVLCVRLFLPSVGVVKVSRSTSTTQPTDRKNKRSRGLQTLKMLIRHGNVTRGMIKQQLQLYVNGGATRSALPPSGGTRLLAKRDVCFTL